MESGICAASWGHAPLQAESPTWGRGLRPVLSRSSRVHGALNWPQVCVCLTPPSVFLWVTQQLDVCVCVGVGGADRTWTREADGHTLVCPRTHAQDPFSGPTKSWGWTSKGWATAWLPAPLCPDCPLLCFLNSNLEEDVYQGRKITHFISQLIILIRNGNRHTAWGLHVYPCPGLQNVRKLGDSWRNLPEPRNPPHGDS